MADLQSEYQSIREEQKLREDQNRERNWKRWGPYLSERQWGTVREDYSETGDSWRYFPHDHARSRTYRWGEDGLLGITDRQNRLCFAVALWNGQDPILKERLFGLAGPEGNHGEDVKECYYYLESSPTHSYMKALYKYPQNEFPYKELLDENRQRDRLHAEYELIDTDAFQNNEYFDVFVEYAKAGPDDILIRVRIANRSIKMAPIHLLPTLWFRNVWSWGREHESSSQKPEAELGNRGGDGFVDLCHETLGDFSFLADPKNVGFRRWLVTENETNNNRHPGLNPNGKFFKDAFHEFVVDGNESAVNSERHGSKFSPCYFLEMPAESEAVWQFRLTRDERKSGMPIVDSFGEQFDRIFTAEIAENDRFYRTVIPASVNEAQHNINRQCYAGLLWTKQFYYYAVEYWQQGDPNGPEVAKQRIDVRNSDWGHAYNRDIISMPDKWEYPWYAAWDLAFHMLPFAKLDSDFAKQQLVLFLREWYMHPNGQIPAYEWALGDVNPPVHAWACWKVYQHCRDAGDVDLTFLSRTFQKLLLNFTWWVNQKDVRGNHVFAGGFLGLDNIGIFDRSKPLPTGGHLEQADGTAWMAFYSSSMLSMAIELAPDHLEFGDMASKFFEHYVSIAEAMNTVDGRGLWDETDGFYYDHLFDEGHAVPLKIRSLVGLIPLITVNVLYDDQIEKLPGFKKRMDWFLKKNKDIGSRMSYLQHTPKNESGKCLLAIPSEERLRRILTYMLDENEFLSDFGIRSLSKYHEANPFTFNVHGEEYKVQYVPGDSDSWMFGGNSNWRGPIWFPMNYLLIEALYRYHDFFGDSFQIECPIGSGNLMTLDRVAEEIQRRLIRIFECDGSGRPCHQKHDDYTSDPNWKDLVLFYEYFHGDDGHGLGASHQTGWTALVANLYDKLYR